MNGCFSNSQQNLLRSLNFLIRNAYVLFLEQGLTTSLTLTLMDLTYKWSHSIWNTEKLEKSRANHNVCCSIIVQIQHFQLQKHEINAQNKSLLNSVPTGPTCPYGQVYLKNREAKSVSFHETKWRFVHWCFQGCWILIWILTKIYFFEIGSKNIKLFYAEGENNTYKYWRSKLHL